MLTCNPVIKFIICVLSFLKKLKFRQMTLRDTFRKSFFSLLFGLVLLGCSEKKSFTLDNDDIRFAGFYSDYLLLSGAMGEKEGAAPEPVDTAELNGLLVRHGFSRESLTRKSAAYKENPELWRAVLLQVRENIRKKSAVVP